MTETGAYRPLYPTKGEEKQPTAFITETRGSDRKSGASTQRLFFSPLTESRNRGAGGSQAIRSVNNSQVKA